MKILAPKQEQHPDLQRGWTVEVHDAKGLLFARFYGDTAEQAERHAKRYMKPDEDDSALYGAGKPR